MRPLLSTTLHNCYTTLELMVMAMTKLKLIINVQLLTELGFQKEKMQRS